MVLRRRRAWGDTRFADLPLGAGTRKDDLLVGLAVTETKTVTRVIGDFSLNGAAVDENEYSVTIDVGIGVTSREAFDLETLPDPDAVADYPMNGWLYVATQICYQALPTGATPTAMWRKDARFTFDIRAQRKVDRGVLFMVIQNLAAPTAGTMRINGRVRALCLT